ncbi:pirin family protein [Acidobacteria bacterium AH-259-O06]|nr:pirin family protein [Acidobacteria bacterium AH-259-O06]
MRLPVPPPGPSADSILSPVCGGENTGTLEQWSRWRFQVPSFNNQPVTGTILFEYHKAAMYEIVRSEEHYHFENDWLSTYWHFSFDHYYDPNNVQFGPLRVFNDDTVRPGKGFPTHSHREMEIVTYVIEGELKHQDSSGGSGIIGPGEVQRMSAGTGIRHSEFNASEDKPVHFLQMWIISAVPNLNSQYEQKRFTKARRQGVLLPIVSGRNHADALKIHQDTAFYVASLRPENNLIFETPSDRRVYFFVITGTIQMGEHTLKTGDSAKISEERSVPLAAQEESEILLIDLS